MATATTLIPLPSTYSHGLYFRAHSAVVCQIGSEPQLIANREGLVKLVTGKLQAAIPVDGYCVYVVLENGERLIIGEGLSSFERATVRADDLNRREPTDD